MTHPRRGRDGTFSAPADRCVGEWRLTTGFWDLLTRDEQRVLAALGQDAEYRPGMVLCIEGDASTHVFILLDGWVKVVAVTGDGHQNVLALLGSGDIAGETAGETTGHRNATMRATGTVHALIVDHDRFSSFLDSHPGAGRAYRRMMTRRWSEAGLMLRSRAATSGAQRLAGLLLDLAGRHGIRAGGAIEVALPLSQEELASLAGTSRATVTRALGSWRKRGFIRTGQRRITITDPRGLRHVAGRFPRLSSGGDRPRPQPCTGIPGGAVGRCYARDRSGS
jgi:CRP/FNR family cyclic AMP-dependent transcriptional regulator